MNTVIRSTINVIRTLFTVVVFYARLQVVCAILAPPSMTVSANSSCLEDCFYEYLKCNVGCSSAPTFSVCENGCEDVMVDCKAICYAQK